jgi:carbon monoxide dehydrogenase subunit G
MEVRLEKTYPVDAPLEACWRVLSDMTVLAECMPGAEITAQQDPGRYQGLVKLKVGPASGVFKGDVEIQSVDALANVITLLGKGADKGGASASMQLTAALRAESAQRTYLTGRADVIVNGRFAQFGGRLMESAADMVLSQFAGNFAARAIAESAQNLAVPVPAELIRRQENIDGIALFRAMMRDAIFGLLKRRK